MARIRHHEKWSICPVVCGPNSCIFSWVSSKTWDSTWETFPSLPLAKRKPSAGSPRARFPREQSHRGEFSVKEFLCTGFFFSKPHFRTCMQIAKGFHYFVLHQIQCSIGEKKMNTTEEKSGHFRMPVCTMLNTQQWDFSFSNVEHGRISASRELQSTWSSQNFWELKS